MKKEGQAMGQSDPAGKREERDEKETHDIVEKRRSRLGGVRVDEWGN